MDGQRRPRLEHVIPYTLGGLKIASWILVALLLAGSPDSSAKPKTSRM
jgi:hypothetical protein